MINVSSLGTCTLKRALPELLAPRTALMPWRTNLTDLSNIHNLYFVVEADQVFVYEPIFPSQGLSPTPRFSIYATPSEAGLRGYIDNRYPRCVNNLVVGLLGTEEVLVVVRDDGDVEAYLTKQIKARFDQWRCDNVPQDTVATDIRPLLHRNVGNSAWGVALHTEARLIAVSSNNHEFNIFSFGLIADDEDGAIGREEDQHIKLSTGMANIPSIAFCNTGHDPMGRYLLTTDVSGLTRWWDLRHRTGPQGLYIGGTPRVSSTFNSQSAGWNVAFLDPRAFREVGDYHEAARPYAASSADKSKEDSMVWDLTTVPARWASVDESCRTPMRPINPNGDAPGRTPRSTARPATTRRSIGRDAGTQSEASSHDTTSGMPSRRIRKVVFSIGGGPQDAVEPPPDHDMEGEDFPDDVFDNDEFDEEAYDAEEGLEPMYPEEDEGYDEDGHGVPLVPDLDRLGERLVSPAALAPSPPPQRLGPAPEPTGPVPAGLINLRRILAQQFLRRSDSPPEYSTDLHLAFANNTAMCPALPCPIFISSVREMYLLQPVPSSLVAPAAQAEGQATDHLPLVYLGDIFGSPCSSHDDDDDDDDFARDDFERCALLAQIPSLGVLVVGNQKGKVAVLSGFKAQRNVDITVPGGEKVRGGVRWVYGLRVEAVLPFRWQDKDGGRPQGQLYGVAVGRMQGEDLELGVGRERWRVMLMWIDETVMSYEIRRKGLGLGVEDLVV